MVVLVLDGDLQSIVDDGNWLPLVKGLVVHHL